MRLASLIVCAGLLVAGCATQPIVAPPLTPSAAVEPNFLVPDVRERMVFLARQEWTLFGQPVVVRDAQGAARLEFAGTVTHEVQPALFSRVLMYWYAVTRLPIVGSQGELEPWSAAFISWLAKSAGLTPEEFPRTVLHWDYIERALAGREGARFVAHDPRVYAPKTGDLVCISRSNAVAGFAELRRGPYHCDLVVGVDAGGIDVIGGNVGDAVALAHYGVDERGMLEPRHDRGWVVVIEQRDAHPKPPDHRRLIDARSPVIEATGRFQASRLATGASGPPGEGSPTLAPRPSTIRPFAARSSRSLWLTRSACKRSFPLSASLTEKLLG